MDRRQFLKIGAAAVGAAAAGYYGADILKLTSRSAFAVQQLQDQTLAAPDAPMDAGLRIPHLLRRAGFGASPDELATYQGMGFDDAAQHLLNYEQVENIPFAAPNIALAYSGRPIGDELSTLAAWWLDRMVRTARPLEEKMTLFWHNHFATGFSTVLSGYLMYQQNEFLRSNALGSFRDLLAGITSDGAMLVWLNGNENYKGNPNENYSREVMEVFTTGRGPYTQTDVEEGARAFTGFAIDADGTGIFVPSQHDDGQKIFLGESGDLDPWDVVDILVERPETAANLSAELFEFFAYPNPSQATVSRLSEVYFRSRYSVKAVVEAILTSDEFVSRQAYLANVKSPVEYVTTALRSLGATVEPGAEVATTNDQGQLLFDPPSVFGWPSGLYWINTGSMMERFNFPLNIQTTSQNGASLFDPQDFFARGGLGGDEESDAGVEKVSQALFPDGMPDEVLEVIRSSTREVEGPTLKAKNAVRLVMSSPFYNLN